VSCRKPQFSTWTVRAGRSRRRLQRGIRQDREEHDRLDSANVLGAAGRPLDDASIRGGYLRRFKNSKTSNLSSDIVEPMPIKGGIATFSGRLSEDLAQRELIAV